MLEAQENLLEMLNNLQDQHQRLDSLACMLVLPTFRRALEEKLDIRSRRFEEGRLDIPQTALIRRLPGASEWSNVGLTDDHLVMNGWRESWGTTRTKVLTGLQIGLELSLSRLLLLDGLQEEGLRLAELCREQVSCHPSELAVGVRYSCFVKTTPEVLEVLPRLVLLLQEN